MGAAWPAGEVGERARELRLVRDGGPEQVVVREHGGALRLLLELPRSVAADEGHRSGPPAVVWVLAVLLGAAWVGQRVAPVGGWRLARRALATPGSRAPPRLAHA